MPNDNVTNAVRRFSFASGASASDVQDVASYRLFGLDIPAGFSGTHVEVWQTRDGTPGNAQLVRLDDSAGTPVRFPVTAGGATALDTFSGAVASFRYLQLRSVTSAGAAVTQGAARVVHVVAKA